MTKFYAVKKGKKTGIFSTWDECKEQVTGFKGAVYKSFKTLSEAEAFLEKNEKKIENIEEVDGVYAYIDGSFDRINGIYGSGVVIVDGDKKHEYKYAGNREDYAQLHNVAGELEAAKFVMWYAVDKKIKEIRIIPKLKARYFEIQYVYESKIEKLNLNKENALGIDLGINNLCTCVSNNGRSFIIDGRKLKSINQFYNKRNASLQALKDTKKKIKEKIKLLQAKITMKRNNRVNDYLSKTARMIINYCIENDIGKIVIGYNVTFQRNSNIGKVNNQNFVNIPYGKLRDKLEYLCIMYGIEYILQEESYTSKASFFDKDDLPEYNADNPQEYIFSGKRIKRGLYKTKKGNLINADVNGALNILRKSNVVDLNVLCDRGELDTPKRIRII